jgi:hypothetical protein
MAETSVKPSSRKSLGLALAAAGLIAAAGTIAVAQADKPGPSPLPGYTKDQCKKGGWQNFQNPDGSPMFKNQGDCVSFFATGGKNKPNG